MTRFWLPSHHHEIDQSARLMTLQRAPRLVGAEVGPMHPLGRACTAPCPIRGSRGIYNYLLPPHHTRTLLTESTLTTTPLGLIGVLWALK